MPILKFILIIYVVHWQKCYGHSKQNKDVSSANSFTVDLFFPDKLLIYTKKNKTPKMDLCSTPVLAGNQFDDCLLSITYWNLLLKKLLQVLGLRQ